MTNLKPHLPILELVEMAVNKLESQVHESGVRGVELVVVVIAGLIFAGGMATALSIGCMRYRR